MVLTSYLPSSSLTSASSPLHRVQGLSTPIQVLSVLRIGAGLSAFVAPAFLTSKLCECGHIIFDTLSVPSSDWYALFLIPLPHPAFSSTKPPKYEPAIPGNSMMWRYHTDGFTTRQTSGAGATANTTTAKPGAPEETLSAIRLAGSRDIVLGLALRDSTSIVVERALELGFISSVIDALAVAYGFFIEGSISPEVSFLFLLNSWILPEVLIHFLFCFSFLADRHRFRYRCSSRNRTPILPPNKVNVYFGR